MPKHTSVVVHVAKAPVIPSQSRRLYNADLASRLKTKRQTGTSLKLATFWASDVHNLGSYVIAASLFALGLRGWQMLLSVLIGSLLVQFLSHLIAKPSQLTGVPFPVACRLSFGVYGASVPTLIRAAITTLWYGFQTYLASVALRVLLLKLFPELSPYAAQSHAVLGLSPLGHVCWGVVWSLQVVASWNEWSALKRVSPWSGPTIAASMTALALWIAWKTGAHDLVLGLRETNGQHLDAGATLGQMASALGLVVSAFAGAMLRVGDSACNVRSYAAAKRGNLFGIPLSFASLALLAVATSTGAFPLLGVFTHSPLETLARLDAGTVGLFCALLFMSANMSLSVTTYASSVGLDAAAAAALPINRRGGRVLAAIAAWLLTPWNWFDSPRAIFASLDVIGALAGPVIAILIVDFYGAKAQRVKLDALYSESAKGRYWYQQGVNWLAMRALCSGLVSGLVLCLSSRWFVDAAILRGAAHFAWLVGALVGGIVYYVGAADEEPLVLTPSQVMRVRQLL
jgi:NCS1 family nucleobase:cation symporter-1